MTNEKKLERALHLIKIHIEAEDIARNRDLHTAVQLIVDVAREHGYLLEGRRREEPEDDALCCPDCERPNWFGEQCPACRRDACLMEGGRC